MSLRVYFHKRQKGKIVRDCISKIETLQLKGIAITIMMFHHCFLDSERYNGMSVVFTPFTETSINKLAAFFKICVGMYVFLSAYGMTCSIRNYKFSDFEKNNRRYVSYLNHRFLRLLSGYWFIFFISSLLTIFIDATRFVSVYGKGRINAVIYYILDFLGIAHLTNTPTLCGTWWYMSLALIIILLFPLLIELYKHIGIYLILFCMFVPLSLNYAIESKIPDIARWGGAVAIGICMAESNKWTKWHLSKNTLIAFITLSLGIICCFMIRKASSTAKLIWIWDSIIPVYMIYYCWRFVLKYHWAKIFIPLGKHSMNIFLFHTFIRGIWWHRWVYSFKYFGLITIMLLLVSLIVSILFEFIKEKTHWDERVIQLFQCLGDLIKN